MGRLFKDSKLYAIDSSQSTVKEIAQYYHRGQPVSMMYHKGKLVYEVSGPSEYVQEGLLFELDCKKGVGTYTWKSRRCNDMPSFEYISGYPYYNSETVEYDIQRLPLHKDGSGVLFEYKEVVTEEGVETVPTVLLNKRLPFPIKQYEGCFKVTPQWSLSLNVVQQYNAIMYTAVRFEWSNETYPQLEPGELCTISYNTQSGETYINGVPLSSSRMARRSSDAVIVDFDFVFFMGVGLTLYEFRYYENSLSDDDVKYNYSIDQKRFAEEAGRTSFHTE